MSVATDSSCEDAEMIQTARYVAEYQALREHIGFLSHTRVLFPNTVAKNSQLDL
jgi:hypothetical protein